MVKEFLYADVLMVVNSINDFYKRLSRLSQILSEVVIE